MIKIELVKFEAQDVITASSVPMIPLFPATPVNPKPVDNCACHGDCAKTDDGYHYGPNSIFPCEGNSEGKHTCGN